MFRIGMALIVPAVLATSVLWLVCYRRQCWHWVKRKPVQRVEVKYLITPSVYEILDNYYRLEHYNGQSKESSKL